MRSRIVRILASAAAALVVTTAVSACGGDEPAASGADAAVLRLGYFPNITHAPAVVGVRNKIFRTGAGRHR